MAALIILTLAACAVLASNANKPFMLRIDGPDANPATWPKDASKADLEMIESWSCMKTFTPPDIRTKKRRGVTQT